MRQTAAYRSNLRSGFLGSETPHGQSAPSPPDARKWKRTVGSTTSIVMPETVGSFGPHMRPEERHLVGLADRHAEHPHDLVHCGDVEIQARNQVVADVLPHRHVAVLAEGEADTLGLVEFLSVDSSGPFWAFASIYLTKCREAFERPV